jgi:hypothetical protein
MRGRERRAQHRRLSARRPGAHSQRQWVEAGLIYPDDGASLLGSFFQRRRALLPPGRDRGRVALACLLTGLLHALPQCVQQPADVRRVVADAEAAPDHDGYPLARPDLSTEAKRLGPTRQERRDWGPLRGRELGPPTGRPAPAQRLHAAAVTGAREPLADRSRRHAQRGGDVLLFPALLFEFPGASPSLAPVEPGRLHTHGASIASL